MPNFYPSIPTNAQCASQPVLSLDSIIVTGGFFLFFLVFCWIASMMSGRSQQPNVEQGEAEQLEADREFLERIWQLNSNLER